MKKYHIEDSMFRIRCHDIQTSKKVCSLDCPWTGESRGVDYGCLPCPQDFVKLALEKGEILSCHSNHKIPCVGIKSFLKKRGVDISKLKLVPNEG